MTNERPHSAPNRNGEGLWWIIPFDVLLGCLCFFCFVGDLRDIRSPDPESGESDRLISLIGCVIDGGIAFALLVAGFLLLRRKQAVLFQRTAFWALLLRSGLVLVELFLPSEGGVGGILLMGALLFLVFLTVMALTGALALGRYDQQAQIPTMTLEQPEVWPPPPTGLL